MAARLGCIVLVVYMGCHCVHSQAGCETYKLTVDKHKPQAVIIKTPNYPNNYSNGMDLCWQFTVDEGSLQYIPYSIDTERCCDYIRVFDGSVKTSLMLVQMSGSSQGAHMTSYTGNKRHMLVTFTSDPMKTGKGVRACVCPSRSCGCAEMIDSRWEHDDHRRDHDEHNGDHHGLTTVAIVGIVFGCLAMIGIIVGAIVTARCRHKLMTPHPQSLSERRRRASEAGEVEEKVIPSMTSPPGGSTMSWVRPVQAAQPPAYTVFTLPPPYTDVTGPAGVFMPTTALSGPGITPPAAECPGRRRLLPLMFHRRSAASTVRIQLAGIPTVEAQLEQLETGVNNGATSGQLATGNIAEQLATNNITEKQATDSITEQVAPNIAEQRASNIAGELATDNIAEQQNNTLI